MRLQHFIMAAVLAVSLAAAADEGEGVKLKDFVPQCPAVDTLKVEYFEVLKCKQDMWAELSPFNEDFNNLAQKRSLAIFPGRPELTYKYWFQDAPAPLAVVLPGLGAHFSSSTNTAMAELLFDHGFSVLAISNTFNHEFMDAALTALTPGYTPSDAQDVQHALKLVLADLPPELKAKITDKVLVGYSMGALLTLFVSDLENDNPQLKFSRYLAINPPVNLVHSLDKLDEFYDVWAEWPEDKVKERFLDAAAVYLGMINKKFPQNAPLPLTQDQAKLLVGYSFRAILREAIYAINLREDMDILKTPSSWSSRNDLYHEIERYGYRRYMEIFIRKYYSQRRGEDVTVAQMNREASLPAIVASLRTNDKIRVLHNADDFLLSDTDKVWLRNTLGDRLTLFRNGAHLGNLYLPQVKAAILANLPTPPKTSNISQEQPDGKKKPDAQ